MKTPPPDRSSIIKELEKRLLKKWAEEQAPPVKETLAVAKPVLQGSKKKNDPS